MAIGWTDGTPKRVAACTPSDATDLTGIVGFYVGVSGNVAVMGIHDSAAVTLLAVPQGSFVPGNFKRVMATNTTATDIVLFY